MPSRLLREGIIESAAVNALSFPAEVFYRRLMSVVDDFGRFDGRAAVLRGRLYALKLDAVREADISRWIAECEKAGLIVLYAADSKPYLLFRKLGPARAKESKFPPPPDPNTHPFTDVNNGVQLKTDVPYSGSGSGSDTSSGAKEDPPNPPRPGGKSGDPAAVPVPAALDTSEFRAAWADWLADRKARRKPVTPRAAAAQLGKLAEFGEAWAVARLTKAIANGWTGLVFDDDVPGHSPPPARRGYQNKTDELHDLLHDLHDPEDA